MARTEEVTMLTRTFLLGVIIAGGCLGQSEPAKAGGTATEPRYFHLDFVVKELDGGKTVNARAYAITASTDRERTSVRTGNKVPVPSGPRGSPANTQFTYVDVGTNIDCAGLKEVQGHLTLMVTADVSSALGTEDASSPVIRQVRWNAPAIVPLGKPTVIFSADDPSSKRQMQLELTARPIN
jgi:hypothetical protein